MADAPTQPQPAPPEQAPQPNPTQPDPTAPQPTDPNAPVQDPAQPVQPDPQQPTNPPQSAPDPAAPAEEGQSGLAAYEAAYEQGFYGTNVDPRPNSDYSLESGPQAPSQLEQQRDAAQATVDHLDGLVEARNQEG